DLPLREGHTDTIICIVGYHGPSRRVEKERQAHRPWLHARAERAAARPKAPGLRPATSYAAVGRLVYEPVKMFRNRRRSCLPSETSWSLRQASADLTQARDRELP